MPGYAGPWYIWTPPMDPDDSGDYFPVDPATVGQFTGITDKDGKKIFEGDIVKFPSPFYQRNEYGSVLWSNDEAKFNIYASDWHGDFEDFEVRDLKVIGDVF